MFSWQTVVGADKAGIVEIGWDGIFVIDPAKIIL
jgi:hypothetical protein